MHLENKDIYDKMGESEPERPVYPKLSIQLIQREIMKKRKSIVLMAACLVAVCLAAQFNISLKAATDDHIANGVYIGNIYVGGMTEEEASAAVDAYIESAGAAEFTLYVDDRSVVVSAEDMGISVEKANVIQQAMDICRSGDRKSVV